jgi:DDE superfamily endonuclease
MCIRPSVTSKNEYYGWMSTGHKGSMHDSMAFLETKLFKVLEDYAAWLEDKEFFIVGDSAYPLMSCFLMVPFADAAPQSPEDAFNF